jgi:ubiquinone/menaquinone biosynthesis C-methylase UbiE
MLRSVARRWPTFANTPSLTQCDAQALPFKDGSVDAVLAMHLLYHVADVERAVRELRRVSTLMGWCW